MALEALEDGQKISRQSWKASTYLMLQVPDEHSKMSRPYIYVECPDYRVPWIPSQGDLLADDWTIFDGVIEHED